MAELKTKALSELLDYHFNIPSYQRGYRWDNQQVTDLLDDLLEYSDTKNGEYYCLQPIAVKKNDMLSSPNNIVYDVIDGQQRLTTIYLILTYLSDVRKILHENTADKMYSLDFEIRFGKRKDGNDEHYLNDKRFISDTNEYQNDINKFFIFNAYQTIDKWFKSQVRNEKLNILRILLGEKGDEQTNVVKVIWYDLSDSKESSTDVFARLNYGKIPLTDAELIKAILLECKKEDDSLAKEKAFRVSCEWDEMEKKLHEPNFWGFLSTSDSSNSRMTFILDKVAREIQSENHYGFSEEKAFFDYHVVNKYVEENGSNAVENLWNRIQNTFSVFENWYSDNELYHKIGYLTSLLAYTYRTKHKDLKKQSQTLIDSLYIQYKNFIKVYDFSKYLDDLIASKVRLSSDQDLEDLNYNDNKSELIKILLLFNVHTAMSDREQRYSFDRQKRDNITSLEHIHPQNLDVSKIKDTEDCYQGIIKPWIDGLSKKITVNDKVSKIFDFIDYDYYRDNIEQFKELVPEVDNHYLSLVEMKGDDIHLISNMALISKETNSALSNNFLDRKRQILRETSYYVPCCTWNVFNKTYSESPEDLIFWRKEDRIAYLNAIKAVYNLYVNPVIDQSNE